jgi:hypothetical protein
VTEEEKELLEGSSLVMLVYASTRYCQTLKMKLENVRT